MSTEAQVILEQFRALSLDEQREVSHFILEHVVIRSKGSGRTISDIAGKYKALPNPDAKDHDRGFAEAIG